MEAIVYWSVPGIKLTHPTLLVPCSNTVIRQAIDLRLHRKYHGTMGMGEGGIAGTDDVFMKYTISEFDNAWLHNLIEFDDIAGIRAGYDAEIASKIISLPDSEIALYIKSLYFKWNMAKVMFKQLTEDNMLTITTSKYTIKITTTQRFLFTITVEWATNTITLRNSVFLVSDLYDISDNTALYVFRKLQRLERAFPTPVSCKINNKDTKLTLETVMLVYKSLLNNVPINTAAALS